MKRLMSILLTLVLMLSVAPGIFQTASADILIEGDFTYEIADGTATVTQYDGSGGAVTIPDNLGGYPVTAIGSNAFVNNSDVTSIAMPNTVTRIGEAAFARCTALTDIILSSNTTEIDSYAFYGCSALTGITLPDTVSSVGDGVFAYCTGLTSFIIPSSMSEVPSGLLSNCTALTEVTIPASVTRIKDLAFSSCGNLTGITLPAALTEIGAAAFAQCTSLTEFVIPDRVETIGQLAIANCTGLTEITIPASVTRIGPGAFGADTGLQTIRFLGPAPEFTVDTSSDKSSALYGLSYCFYNVTATAYYPAGDPSWTEDVRQDYNGTITWVPVAVESGGKCGDNATWTLKGGTLTISGTGDMYVRDEWTNWYSGGEASIRTIIVNSGITSISSRAFESFVNLEAAALPETVTDIGEFAFLKCSALKSANIPQGLTILSRGIFSGCSSLSEITIPSGVTEICHSVFADCSSLTEITIPQSVDAIGIGAFYNCDGLTELFIPNITTINSNAFSRCDGLTTVKINGRYNATIGNGAFERCSNLTSVELNRSIISIGNHAFSRCPKLETINCGAMLNSIGDSAFFRCTSLAEIHIPYMVERIGERTFYGCSSLTNVYMGQKTAEIGDYAFANCSSLEHVVFSPNLRAIGEWAFWSCTKIDFFSFNGPAPSFGSNCFINVTARGYYPAGNPTWTDSVRQNYGGKITWIAEKGNIPERMWGATRQTTAVAISRAAFPYGSDNVILAYELDAPILLIRRSRPDQATLDEIRRLGAKNVYILGGAGVVSDAVADTMKDMGLTVERIAGANRFDTAVAVAEKLETLRGAKPTTVFFVYSHNYPDALAVSNVASLMGAPILYVDNTGNLRDSTAAYLKHLGSVEKAYIISGPGVIRPNADTAIGAFGPVQRIYGADRYETCTRINRTFADVLDGNSLCLACGTNYPDALAGSVFAAKYHAPMVLVRGGLTAEQAAYVKEKAPENVYAFGGAGVLPDSVLEAVKKAAR